MFTNNKITKKTFGPYLEITTSCTPKYVEDCIIQINNVIKNLNIIITDDDFKKVKNKIKGAEFDCLKVARHNLSLYNLYKKQVTVESYNKELIKVDKKDIMEFIDNNINKESIVCLYGPNI